MLASSVFVEDYLCVYACVCPSGCASAGCPWKPEEGVGCLGAGGIGNCELLDVYAGVWIQGLLIEQQALLTDEPNLQLYFCFVWDKIAVALLG